MITLFFCLINSSGAFFHGKKNRVKKGTTPQKMSDKQTGAEQRDWLKIVVVTPGALCMQQYRARRGR
jgi:hypothetical protein